MAVTVVLSLLGAVVLLVVAAFIALLVVRRVRPQLLDSLPEPVRRLATASSLSDLRAPSAGQSDVPATGAAAGDEKGALTGGATAIENPIYASTLN